MSSTLSLFHDIPAEAPPTEGIKYAGSKLKLIPYILQLARETGASSVLDGFAGTTRVSQAFARSGYEVICNDIAVWSEVLGTCYLLSTKPSRYYQDLIDHLNSVKPKDGWFTEHYGGYVDGESSVQDDGYKKPWQIHNTRKLDAIRQEIDFLELDHEDRCVCLTSLILALDKVDSTLGHFTSYLREWSARSYGDMILKVPRIVRSDKNHVVLRRDIFDIINQTDVELSYFDPPYGSNNEKMPPSRVRYAAYYHLWTTICLNDKPEVFGNAKRRTDSRDTATKSDFEDFRRSAEGPFIAVLAIDRLLKECSSPWIILSYSSGGRATAAELHDVISARGRLAKVIELDYKRNVMADMTWTHEWIADAQTRNREFLFLIEKR